MKAVSDKSLRRDWNSPHEPAMSRARLAGLVAVVAVLLLWIAAIELVVTRNLPLTLGITVMLVGLAVGGTGLRSKAMLRKLKAVRATSKEAARLRNLSAGIAGDLGMPVPELWVIPEGGPNALVCLTPKPTIAVTSSLLADATRTQLEAVVAHCLVRLASPGMRPLGIATQLGPLGRPFAPRVGFDDDVRAAALIRYPPALGAAIESADPAPPRYGPAWFVARSSSHRPAEERAEALRDL